MRSRRLRYRRGSRRLHLVLEKGLELFLALQEEIDDFVTGGHADRDRTLDRLDSMIDELGCRWDCLVKERAFGWEAHGWRGHRRIEAAANKALRLLRELREALEKLDHELARETTMRALDLLRLEQRRAG